MTTRLPATPEGAAHEDTVRSRLRTDPFWSVYALGDLDARRARHCEWHLGDRSLALLYREFDTPILFGMGDPAIVDAVPEVEACLLQVPEDFLRALARRFTVEWSLLMHRMALDPPALAPGDSSGAEPLDARHEDELRALYEDGRATGEEPDFFMSSQLEDGTFFGVRRGGRLVAAGGTHLFSAEEGVGAVGNVYTHREHRGQGHASVVTRAVTQALLDRGTRTIALNVKSGNQAAIRVYGRLGFRFHSRFWEGRASRRLGIEPPAPEASA